MATLIPDTPKECPHSERILYERLGRDLDREWIILHSLGLHTHEKKVWGEADIVVLSTKGFFALEVKGGHVSCHDGIWTFGTPGGKSYSKREDPWTQSKDTMFAIQDQLLKAEPSMKDLLFGFGVVMPMARFDCTGPEIEPAVLLDRRDFSKNLGFYIGRLSRHWDAVYQARHSTARRMPTPADIRRARQILRPDVEAALSLGSWMTGVEASLLQLSNDQIRASRRMAANPRTIVRGKAGTGKTIIAIERARQLAADGKSVLFLCFNQLLASHVHESLKLQQATGIDVIHAHRLYRDVIASAGMLDRLREEESRSDFYEQAFPDLFVEAVLTRGARTWDVVVIDEAQDLLTLPHVDALDVILKNGINRGRWHIFLDPMQNLYNDDIQEQVMQRLEESQPAFDDLFENCRNTREVAVQASIVSGIDLALEGAPAGPECSVVFHDGASCVAAVEEVVRSLLDSEVRPEDIVVLSPLKRENSCLAGVSQLAGIKLVDVSAAKNETGLLFSTIHGFKGLERRVVLATDMERIGDPVMAKLFYAGLSRATMILRVFLPDTAQPAYDEQVMQFGKRAFSRSGKFF